MAVKSAEMPRCYNINNIDWDQLKQRILDRLLLEYPFLKALSLSRLNMENYIHSHRLMDGSWDQLEIAVKNAYTYLFKMIGMRVDIEEYFGEEVKELEEIKSLSFSPVMTFNLRKGIVLSVNNPNLLRINSSEIIKYINIIREQFTGDKGESIDLFFGDKNYLITELDTLIKNENLQSHIKKLISNINQKYVNSKSNVLKRRFSIITDEEVEDYLQLKNNKHQ